MAELDVEVPPSSLTVEEEKRVQSLLGDDDNDESAGTEAEAGTRKAQVSFCLCCWKTTNAFTVGFCRQLRKKKCMVTKKT